MKRYTGKRKYNSNVVFNQVVEPDDWEFAFKHPFSYQSTFAVKNEFPHPLRVKAYKYPPKPKKKDKGFKAKGALYTLLMILAMLVILLMVLQERITDAKAESADAQINKTKVAQLQGVNKENTDLKLDLKVATAKPRPQQLTDSEAKEMIAKTFPSQFRERFYQITAHCENSTLESDRTHINNDKEHTEDVGMAQINDKWQKARVEKMFGLDFDVAMRMPILNYIYAAYLVDHDQNTHQWACDQILVKKGVLSAI